MSSATLGAVRILRGEEVVAYLPTIVSNSNTPSIDASSNEPKARWDLLNELEKALVITATTANGLAFTLNFDSLVIKDAKRRRKTLGSYLGNRLADALRGVELHWGEDFDRWFVLEIAPGGYVHAHGVISVANDNALPDVKRAMEKASGTDPKSFKGRAVNIQPFDADKQWEGSYGADGWVRYCFKEVHRTPRRLKKMGHQPGRVYVSGRRLTRQGRKAWDQLRAPELQDQKVSPTTGKPCPSWGTW
ncbi:hypothetical protein H261_20819 [Paramagnetospirillum caucaseum]|uniref:Uncharacterized protein n=1 Tax=Paramagnetospirillum caucaseum TaxID=1244869 RepID=M2ZKZ7_9PROT|nr:hypothetical protein [Paramagnetospirillum caucaseum]EME67977.1 hypothetical protein H261_20819 [Paramagnetospirillum caucaseum]